MAARLWLRLRRALGIAKVRRTVSGQPFEVVGGGGIPGLPWLTSGSPQIVQVEELRHREATMQTVELVESVGPLWESDELTEQASLLANGQEPPQLAEPDEVPQILADVRVEVPTRLVSTPAVEPSPDSGLDTVAFEYLLVRVPTSFHAPPDVTLRRMHLHLRLSLADSSSEEAEQPVAVTLLPDDDWLEGRIDIGRIDIDLYKAAAALLPVLPKDAAKVELAAKLGWSTRHPKVQCSGHQTRDAHWLVADERIAGTFSGIMVVQIPAGARLLVAADLAVEVRKRLLARLRKTYAKPATPVTYHVRPGSGGASRREFLFHPEGLP